MIKSVEKQLSEEGIVEIVLHARTHVKLFYGKLGYTQVGECFYEITIPHVKMFKLIA